MSDTETLAEVLDDDELNELVDLIAAARDKAPRLPTDADSWDVLDAITPTIHRILAAPLIPTDAGEGALREALTFLDGLVRGYEAHASIPTILRSRVLQDLTDLRAALTTADPS